MSYIGPIHYDPYGQVPSRTSSMLVVALILAASIFVTLLLLTASIAVKINPAQMENVIAGP